MTAIDLKAYRQLFDEMPVAALLLDDQGNCLKANEAASDLLGESLADPTWNVFEADHVRGDELAYLVESLRKSGSVDSHDAMLYGPDGGRLVRISGHRIFNDSLGKHVTWMVLGDVTDRSAAAYQLAQVNRQLEESNRQLDQFASMAAHDLKAPARRVRMFAQLLSNDANLGELARGFVVRILASGAQMEDIIDSLLQFAGVSEEAGDTHLTAMKDVLQQACASCAKEVKEAGYEVHLEGTFPIVTMNRAAVEQLIVNLVHNAVKFRRPDVPGQLTITSRDDERSGNHVLTFSDNGVGFPNQDSGHLFEMLYRAHSKAEFEGNGIGLAICQRICKGHGWRIQAASPNEFGATFQITIPKEPTTSRTA
ncbi:MAG: ATP-binding protein [Acidimicrobiia bacterium]|nr:ATP-binding protein [Acidimicrobiia bacterium]MDH5502613.1 ATP-binding protein [Acidimicrobiia bacterium]